MKLFFTKDEDLYDKSIEDMFANGECLIRISGCTGEQCLRLKIGTVH